MIGRKVVLVKETVMNLSQIFRASFLSVHCQHKTFYLQIFTSASKCHHNNHQLIFS